MRRLILWTTLFFFTDFTIDLDYLTLSTDGFNLTFLSDLNMFKSMVLSLQIACFIWVYPKDQSLDPYSLPPTSLQLVKSSTGTTSATIFMLMTVKFILSVIHQVQTLLSTLWSSASRKSVLGCTTINLNSIMKKLNLSPLVVLSALQNLKTFHSTLDNPQFFLQMSSGTWV